MWVCFLINPYIDIARLELLVFLNSKTLTYENLYVLTDDTNLLKDWIVGFWPLFFYVCTTVLCNHILITGRSRNFAPGGLV